MKNFLFIGFLCQPLFALARGQQSGTIAIPLQEYMQLQQQGNQGCLSSMIQAVSGGVEQSLQAQSQEVNALINISEQYRQNEESCGNELAQIRMELDNLRAEHEEREMLLPAQIAQAQLEYRAALLEIEQQCEETSGAQFQAWHQQQTGGVLTADRGGVRELFGRTENLARFQPLFQDQCLASRTNVERSNIAAQALALQVKQLQDALDASAMRLARTTESMSFRQGVVVENCRKAEAQLDYQAQLQRGLASAANSAARTQNFLGMLDATQVCIGGMGNRNEVTRSGVSTGTRE